MDVDVFIRVILSITSFILLLRTDISSSMWAILEVSFAIVVYSDLFLLIFSCML